jgi:hypothetical protein
MENGYLTNDLRDVQRFEWHDKCYLGAAHGLGGILHTLSMFEEAELATASCGFLNWDYLRVVALRLIKKYAFPSGNMMTSVLGDINK